MPIPSSATWIPEFSWVDVYKRQALDRIEAVLDEPELPNNGNQHIPSKEMCIRDRDLAATGAVIVSGMARGIDSCSHRGALAAEGKTIAVLGCGVDVVYPPENQELYDEIAKKGLLISEYLPGAEPLGNHFPARNRIISGLSTAVILVEAGERSGCLLYTSPVYCPDGRAHGSFSPRRTGYG